RGIFHLVLRLLSAGSLPAFVQSLHRERPFHQRRNRKAPPERHLVVADREARRGRHRVGVVHLRYRKPRRVWQERDQTSHRRKHSEKPVALRPRRYTV